MQDVERLYIAYGSNLNLKQMKLRCPTAKVYGKGTLKDYRLLFKGSYNNAFATIEQYKGGRVPALVWNLQPDDERSLDYYEGFPNFYYKDNIKVRLKNGETVIAMVYIMTDKIKERIQFNMPSTEYLRTVGEGYKNADFDAKVLLDALIISAEVVREREYSK